jgi:hypothetical protein
MVAGRPQAFVCKFVGTPRMLCVQEIVLSPKVVTDITISAACPVDVMVASRVGLNFQWLVYAPAGKGVEVHGASLPLELKQALTIGIVKKGADDVPLDIRCGVTTVWHHVAGEDSL